MTLAMEQDVATRPRDKGLLGSAAVVASADGVANTVEEARLPGRRHCLPQDARGAGRRRTVRGEDHCGHGWPAE